MIANPGSNYVAQEGLLKYSTMIPPYLWLACKRQLLGIKESFFTVFSNQPLCIEVLEAIQIQGTIEVELYIDGNMTV